MLKKLLICLFFIPLSVYAANFQQISDIGSSSDMISRGNIQGFSKGAQLVFENNAALAELNSYSASFFTTTFYNESRFTTLSLTLPLSIGNIGFGYMVNTVDDIAETTTTTIKGYFDYSNRFYTLSYSNSWFNLHDKPLYLGISLLRYEHNLKTSVGRGTDFMISSFYKFNHIEFSTSLKHILKSKVNYSANKDENLPVEFLFSSKYNQAIFPLYFQYKRSHNTDLLSLALDFKPNAYKDLRFSAGYKSINVLKKVYHNLTYGLQLNLSPLTLSYAYETSSHILYDGKHYFTLTYIKQD